MNKADLIAKVAQETGLTKNNAEKAVNAIFGTQWTNGIIIDAVASGDTVQLTGFGTFKSVHRAARVGRNPQTGEEINIPERTSPKFDAGSRFKGALA